MKDSEDRKAYMSPRLVLMERLNLREEMKTVPSHGVIWDVGCGTGDGTEELFSGQGYRVLLVDMIKFANFRMWPQDFTFKRSLVENLDDPSMIRNLQSKHLFPADLIVASNVLKYADLSGSLPIAMKALYAGLAAYGKLLVYEDQGDYYSDIIKLGIGAGFRATQHPTLSGLEREYYPFYLRLTKS